MRRHARATALVMLGLLSCPADVVLQGPDPAPAEALARRASARMQALQREAESLAARERTLLDDLRRLEVERDLRTEEFGQGARELDQIQRELRSIADRTARLRQEARLQLPDLSGRMVDLYKLGNAGYARLLLNVDDLRELSRAYRFVSALQGLDRRRIVEHQRITAALQREQAALEARQSRQVVVQQNMAAARDAASRAASALSALIDDIDAQRDLNARLVGELQVAHRRLQDAVAEMARGTADAAPVTLPLRPFKGDLDWPAHGPVISRFGRQRNPRFRTSVASNGILIAAERGTPVRAIHEGTVAFAEPFPGFGNLLILDHGGLGFTMYGHLAEITARAGTHVARGQDIGSVGATIDGTTALYFELRIDGKPVDPLQWLRKP